jgi:hypothetical protein
MKGQGENDKNKTNNEKEDQLFERIVRDKSKSCKVTDIKDLRIYAEFVPRLKYLFIFIIYNKDQKVIQ